MGLLPSQEVYSYAVRNPEIYTQRDESTHDNQVNPYRVGDTVYVKPVDAKCTTVWPMAR